MSNLTLFSSLKFHDNENTAQGERVRVAERHQEELKCWLDTYLTCLIWKVPMNVN